MLSNSYLQLAHKRSLVSSNARPAASEEAASSIIRNLPFLSSPSTSSFGQIRDD